MAFLKSSIAHFVLGALLSIDILAAAQPWATPYTGLLSAIGGILTALGAASLPQTLGK